MVYDPTVVSPTNLEEVYEILAERGRRAKIIAGGTDLMVAFNAKSLAAGEFIDIWRLNELRDIDDEGETIRIGALTTYTPLIRSPLIQLSVPALVEASRTTLCCRLSMRRSRSGVFEASGKSVSIISTRAIVKR